MYNIMSSTYNDSFTYYFSIWTLFIPFSSLTAMTRTSKTILKQNGENGHYCLAPDLTGNSFKFTQLQIMLFLLLLWLTTLAEAWGRSDPRVPHGPARGKSVYEVVRNSEKTAIGNHI